MSAKAWNRRRAWQRVRMILRRTGRWQDYRPLVKAAERMYRDAPR